jgi:ATP-dependent helicase Lhr and Lhr-like helicase
VLIGGVLALYVERGGRTILSYVDDEGALATATKALRRGGARRYPGGLSVERTDGAPMHNSPLGRALTAAGFRQTPRGLRLGG